MFSFCSFAIVLLTFKGTIYVASLSCYIYSINFISTLVNRVLIIFSFYFLSSVYAIIIAVTRHGEREKYGCH